MTTDPSCTIEWCNDLGIDVDDDMITAVFTRAALSVPRASTIRIYPSARRPGEAFLEWIMRIEYRDGNGGITIGCVQREPGGRVEFHS